MEKSHIEARITFVKTEDGGRKSYSVSGYRPSHLVMDGYLTTGVHNYYDKEKVFPGETVIGTITFITPEAYPHCLWEGKIINIHEGARLVGYAEITKIFEDTLRIV